VLSIRRALAIILAKVRAGQLAALGPRIRARRVRTRKPVVVARIFGRVEGCVVFRAFQVLIVVDADGCSGGCDVEDAKGGKEECCCRAATHFESGGRNRESR
jgi:hypothetical protein